MEHEEDKGFAEPDEEIVAYAKAHNIQLDLRSKVVQEVLRLRMHLPKGDKKASSNDWRHWQE